MQIIGIDIGTTSICGVAIDAESGLVLRSKTINSEAFISSEHLWEKIQSPEKIIRIAKEILDSLLSEESVSIGVTGQMHGILYTDRAGNAVSPLYTWQDERGNQPYNEKTYAEHLGSHAGYGNVTDFYNRVNGLRPKEAVSHCTIHDYFVMRLCGLLKPIMHASDAASLGLFDMETNSFKYDVNADVVAGYTVAGSYQNIPVGVAIGDNQASVFSTLANEDDLLVNVGTGSQISIVSAEAIDGNDIEVRPYFEGKYLIVGAALCGGRAYSILKDFYKRILSEVIDPSDGQVYDIMNRWLDQYPDIAPLAVNTRFAGTRENTALRGRIEEISTDNFDPISLTKGVLSGMVEELHAMYLQMHAKKSGLVGSGNGVRKNQKFVQLAEEKFGAKMKIPHHMEEASYGAALFGAISAGIFNGAKDAQKLIQYKR